MNLLKKILMWTAGAIAGVTVALIVIFPEASLWIIGGILSELTTKKEPKPVYNIVWNVLDDDLRGKKIKIDFYEYDTPFTKTLTIGKTKRLRLPYGSFEESVNKKDAEEKGIYLDLPQGLSMNWREDLDRYEKADAYEIIVFKEPKLTETDESFILSSAKKAQNLSVYYYDKTKGTRSQITTHTDGVFLKSDSEKTEEDVMDDAFLEVKVKSLLKDDAEPFIYKFKYSREPKYLAGDFVEQNGQPLRLHGITLNGEECLEAQYVDDDGNALAGYEATIFALFDDGSGGAIQTQTDANGYVKIDHLPKAEYHITFGDKVKTPQRN